MTNEQDALAIARKLAEAGIPLFLANPADNKTGFVPPAGWQNTVADPSIVDSWRPGLALCAVMGHGLDLVDIDPRNGGELNDEIGAVNCYGIALTPSGGAHIYIKSLGAGSRDNLFPGVDIKGGRADGGGRGFAFIAPTVRKSAVDGSEGTYTWAKPPVSWLGVEDDSGLALGTKITELVGVNAAKPVAGGPDWWQEFTTQGPAQSAQAATRAINNKLAEVTSWAAGSGVGFRTVLMSAAMTLGGYVAADVLDMDDAEARLASAVSSVWGVPDQDDLLWIQQGLTDGHGRPFTVLSAAELLAVGYDDADEYDDSVWTIYNAIGGHDFDPAAMHIGNTDQELAEEVVKRMFPAMRFGADSGSWLIRGRNVWAEREDAAPWAVSTVARLMPYGDSDYPKNKADYTADNWRAKTRNQFMSSGTASSIERKVKGIVRMEGHPGTTEIALLDSEPEILWAGGMPWDLRASGIEPVLAHLDPNTPHLRTALCAPVRLDTPYWDHFVSVVWPDPAVRAWAMRVLSISLAGYADAALPVLYGTERTGKTALITLIMDVLGTYGHAADPRLLGGGDNVHASVVYALKGRRLSFIDEGPRRGHLASERLKQLTGGGLLTGNAMRANPVTFAPTHTLIMTTNDEPPVQDPALKARMRIIPCEGDREVVRQARRAITPAVWKREAPGVLAYLMSETAAWLADQDSALMSAAPAVILGESDDISARQNATAEWVEMNTVPSEPGTAASELYEAFCFWYQSQARFGKTAPVSITAWGRALNELGYPGKKNVGVRKQVYRPLSVMGGGRFQAPWEPSVGPATSGVSYGPIETVGVGRPSEPTPVETPRSSVVSSSLVEGRESIYTPNNTTEEKDIHIVVGALVQGNREKISTPSNSAYQTEPDLQEQGESGCFPSVSPDYQAESPLSKQRAEVAAYAHDKKLTKAQARAELKEVARLEAVAEASGEILSLPAAVDRAGHVVEISADQAGSVVRSCLARTGGLLTVDVEHSGYAIGHKDYYLRSVQLGDDVAAVVLDPIEHAELIKTLLGEAVTLEAFSASADITPLAVAELVDFDVAWSKMIDTVIPAKLADPKSTGSDPGLKQIALAMLGAEAVAPAADETKTAVFKAGGWVTGKQKFGDQLKTPPVKNGWSQIDTRSTAMLRYAASDVLDTRAIAKRLPPVPPALLERERIAEEMTARIGYTGLPIDKARVDELTNQHLELQAEYGEKLRAVGIENPGSGKQVAEALKGMNVELPVSEKGNPSVAKHVLEILKREDTDAGKVAADLLTYRHSSTVLSLFLEPYRLLCEVGDGRARPTVYTLGADTGRATCTRPNFQQLSRRGGVRSLVTADPGFVFVSADFAGVELRGAAALSQDPNMLFAIREEDEGRFDGFHWQVARQAFGPDATKEDRYTAKRGCFGTFYGGGVVGLAQQVGVPEAEMAVIIQSLKQTAPDFFKWANLMRDAVKQGYTQFPAYSGRIIHFPPATPHKAPAYAIQGTCRELLIDALIKWRDTKWGKCVVMPVHDELIAMVPAEDAVEATKALVSCMETELYGVKIVAEPSTPSTYWQDAA